MYLTTTSTVSHLLSFPSSNK